MKQTKKLKGSAQRTQMIALAVDAKLKKKIDGFASREDVSRSQAIRLLLASALVDYDILKAEL